MYWRFKRAFLKLHYMQGSPASSFGPLKSYFLLGKIQKQGQFAGNFIRSFSFLLKKSQKKPKIKDGCARFYSTKSSSETTREVFVLKDKNF